MNIDSFRKLYVHELKDLWSAEKQTLDVLAGAVEAATDEELKAAIENHLSETHGHIGRLETIFENLDFEPGGHRCEGMAGLLKEVQGAFGSEIDEQIRDAMLISSLQRVEHYELAGYGVARTFAAKLGDNEAAELLRATLEEEGKADRMLTELAERRINFVALAD